MEIHQERTSQWDVTRLVVPRPPEESDTLPPACSPCLAMGGGGVSHLVICPLL